MNGPKLQKKWKQEIKEESSEIGISHENEKKDGKKDIVSYSNEENSESTNDKNEQNYINSSNINIKKLIVIIDNYKNLLDN